MSTLIAASVALGLAFAAFAALALAMDRHYEQVMHRMHAHKTLRLCLRAAGAALMLLALWCCVTAWGAVVATLVWLGLLSCAALMTTLALSYMPRYLPALAMGMGVSGALAWMAGTALAA